MDVSNIQSTVKSYTLDIDVTFAIRLIDINEQKPFKTTHYILKILSSYDMRNINFLENLLF